MSVFAIYVDAENVSISDAEKAFRLLKQSGNRIAFAKAYGNFLKLSAWKEFCNRYGIATEHRFSLSLKKNAADIQLTVDAVANLYGSYQYDTVVLISSDSDFFPVVQQARRMGKKIVGVGASHAPDAYIGMCDRFITLDKMKAA